MRTILNIIKPDESITSILPSQDHYIHTDVRYIISDEPKPSSDVLIIHYRELSALLSHKELEYIPYIIYGRSSVISRAFSLGASDFIRLPFELQELEARASRLIRRNSFTVKDKRVTYSHSHISCEGEEEFLSDCEFQILGILLGNCGRVVSRDSLNYRLGLNGGKSRVLDVYINSLRNKISTVTNNGENGKFTILTVRGKGYTINSHISCG